MWTGAPLLVHASLPSGFHDDLVANVTGTPMDIAWTPDGRIIIPMRDGRLRVYTNGALLSTPAIDLSSVVCTTGDESLGGVAVHPNFTLNHYIYLYYTYKKFGTCNTGSTDAPVNRLSRFILSSNNSINPASQVTLLETPPIPFHDHMGDDLQFGNDHYLYLAIGEGGSACCSSTPRAPEDPGVLLGKIVRLTDTGGIPSSNPFIGLDTARCNLNGVPPTGSPAGTKCQEVFAMGLRNPFKGAFDPNTPFTRYFINDVGNVTWEEVNLVVPAADYGWPTREGPCSAANPLTDCGPPPPGITNPTFWYGHNVTANGLGCTAITAGAFVPNGLWPGFDSSYLYADWVCGGIWRLTNNGSGGFTSTLFATVAPSGIISMRFGPYNNTLALYYLFGNYGTKGQLRRISLTGSPDLQKIAASFRLDWADYDNNGSVTIVDLAQVAFVFDQSNSYWDLNTNGRVDITEVAIVAFLFDSGFQNSPFPGQGLPPWSMDASWKSECALLPQPERIYCFRLP